MKFEYEKEPICEILCIDCTSFYASVECVERGLHPLKTMLVVMSGAENAGGLVLAASPMAKKYSEFLMSLEKMKCPSIQI